MFSSRKILYFIIISVIAISLANGIDFRSNVYNDIAQGDTEMVDFSDSGFFAVSESSNTVSIVAKDEGDGANAYFSLVNNEPDVAQQNGEEPPQVTEPDIQETTAEPENNTTTTIDDPIVTTTTSQTQQVYEPIQTNVNNTQPYQTTTTTERTNSPTRYTTTTTTTRIATLAPTTTTTERVYYDTGGVGFNYSQVRIYAGASTTVSLNFPIGSQKYAIFASKDTSIASVRAYNDTTAEITGVSVGTTWIQAKTAGGDYAYCKVVVTDFAGEVLRLTNIERNAQGLPSLTQGDSALQRMANIRLAESVNYFSHTRPNGTKFYTVSSEIGLSYSYIGENLAAGQTTPQQVINEWMSSPTHRSNILNYNYTQLCVANIQAPDGLMYWVQIFYSPF